MLIVSEIRPIRDHVLVRPDAVPTLTAGGLHIPQTVNADNPNYYTMTGTVIACGKGVHDGETFKPVQVKAGDRVVFSRYAGKQIEVDGRHRVLMLKEPEIIGFADTEQIQPGYQAPKFTSIIDRPGSVPI